MTLSVTKNQHYELENFLISDEKPPSKMSPKLSSWKEIPSSTGTSLASKNPHWILLFLSSPKLLVFIYVKISEPWEWSLMGSPISSMLA